MRVRVCVCVSSFLDSTCWLLLHADTFVMGKIHKEIAMFMLEASEDGERSEQSFVKVQAQCMHHTLCRHATCNTPCVAMVTDQCAGPHPEDQRSDLQCTILG